jgi:hypothetical protein
MKLRFSVVLFFTYEEGKQLEDEEEAGSGTVSAISCIHVF